jgi:hypothetical protein
MVDHSRLPVHATSTDAQVLIIKRQAHSEGRKTKAILPSLAVISLAYLPTTLRSTCLMLREHLAEFLLRAVNGRLARVALRTGLKLKAFYGRDPSGTRRLRDYEDRSIIGVVDKINSRAVHHSLETYNEAIPLCGPILAIVANQQMLFAFGKSALRAKPTHCILFKHPL